MLLLALLGGYPSAVARCANGHGGRADRFHGAPGRRLQPFRSALFQLVVLFPTRGAAPRGLHHSRCRHGFLWRPSFRNRHRGRLLLAPTSGHPSDVGCLRSGIGPWAGHRKVGMLPNRMLLGRRLHPINRTRAPAPDDFPLANPNRPLDILYGFSIGGEIPAGKRRLQSASSTGSHPGTRSPIQARASRAIV